MTTDGTSGPYLGKIIRSNGKHLELAADPNWEKDGREVAQPSWAGGAAYILAGTGAGQYKRTASYSGRSVTLDDEWNIAPDETSVVTITALQRHYLIVDNDFADATIAVQFFGVSIEHICAGNTSIRSGGFHSVGFCYAGGWQPCWFHLFLDNKIPDGNGVRGPWADAMPKGSHIGLLGTNPEGVTSPMNRGAVIRGNTMSSNANIEVDASWSDAIIEGNVSRNADSGIVLSGMKDILVGRNEFENVAEPVVETPAVSADPWAR